MATRERLRAVTLLGENTVPIFDDLCRHVSGATGIDVVAENRRPIGSDAAAGRVVDADLIWACGFLMCELLDSGRLDADVVAAPVFAGERGPVYHSVIVTGSPAISSLEDARGGRLAINEEVSWSGHHALVVHLASLGADLSMFDSVVSTGSHAASVAAVAAGTADVAAIDHTLWPTLAGRADLGVRPRIIDRTREWPAPPIAIGRGVAAGDRDSLVSAITSMPERAVDGLTRLEPASRLDYDVMSPRPPGFV